MDNIWAGLLLLLSFWHLFRGVKGHANFAFNHCLVLVWALGTLSGVSIELESRGAFGLAHVLRFALCACH
jgi:hypothetical protein